MASGGNRKLPELRITNKQLEKRSRELVRGNHGGLQQQQSDGSLGHLGGKYQDYFDVTTSSKHESDHQKLGNSISEEETFSKSVKPPQETAKRGGGLFQIKPIQSADSRESGRSYAPGERNRQVLAERHRRGKSDCLWQQQSSARMSDVENESSLTVEDRQVTPKESDGRCDLNARGLIQVDKSVLEAASTRKRGGGRPNKGAHRAAREGASRPLGGEGRRRHSSEGSPRMIGKDREKSALDPELAGLLADVKHWEGQMERAVSRWSGKSAGFDSLVRICLRLQSSCEKLLLLDLEASAKHDIGSRLWRSAHYPIVEALRKQLQTDTETGAAAAEVRGRLEQFLSDSVQFYTTLVKDLQRRHHFQLSRLVSAGVGSPFQSRTHHRKVMLAVFACHWCYIHLGDLSRYQEQLSSKPDWSKPRSLYLKAQLLAPKDGKPYNQLAIIAINAQRRLDAVYYYMRSLMAKNPFLSAHDSLVGLFGETSLKVKRKEDQERVAKERAEREAARKKRKTEKKTKKQLHKRQQQGERSEQLSPSSGRREVWSIPGSGGEREGEGDPRRAKEGEGAGGDGDRVLEYRVGGGGGSSEQTSTEELIKKLTSIFLVTHGKLFTKIGIETYEPVVGRLLRLWRGVLERGVAGGGVSLQEASRFLKMMVINVFSIHHAMDRHTDDEAGRRYYCGLAFALAAQFTAALLETGSELLDCLAEDSEHRHCLTEDSEHRHAGGGESSSREEDSPGSDLRSSGGNSGEEPKPGMPCESGESTGSLTDSDSRSRASQVSDNAANRSGRSDRTHPETRLADSSPAVLRVLDVLSLLLPAARVWFDWLVLQRELWLQFVSAVPRNILHEFWRSAFVFLNRAPTIFSELSAPPPSCSEHPSAPPSCTCPHLWEDKVLAGFMPLRASLTTEETFSIQDVTRLSPHDHRLQCLKRISLLVEACRQLSAEAQLGIGYDAAAGVFSLSEGEGGGEAEEGTAGRDNEGDVVSDLESEGLGKDVIVESSSESEAEGDNETGKESGALEPQDETSAEIEQLKIRREMLARQIEERHLAEETAKTVLDEATNRESQEVCVIPRYLVPDTNCFVDMLPSISALVKLGLFTIAVPLTVLAELEGLGKDCERTDSARVSVGAKSALDYVTAAFSSRQPQVRVLTTHGSLLSSLSFRAELTGKATNDDLILESCLNLHAKVDRGKSTGNSEFYSVVLLTDDRNLRVKAHASGLPVRDIPAFMRLVPPAKKL